MKKILFITLIACFSNIFAAEDDALLGFSTPGPDKYLDGTTVLDGEIYALVWTSNTCSFAGFRRDGSLVSENDRLIAAAPLAKDGHCPTCLFQLERAMFDQLNKIGKFGIYLLDTRDPLTNTLSMRENGRPTIVNASSHALTESCLPGPIGSDNSAKLAEFAKNGIITRDYVEDFDFAANPIILTQTNIVNIAETNIVDVFRTNIIDEINYRTITQTHYSFETNYVVMTNTIPLTNIIELAVNSFITNHIFLTNYVDMIRYKDVIETKYVTTEELHDRIPIVDAKKIYSYRGQVYINGKKAGTLELKAYKPNQYGYSRILMRNFVLTGTKKKNSATAYGLIIDGKWMYANFKKNAGYLEFSGDYAVGEYVLNGVKYQIELEVEK